MTPIELAQEALIICDTYRESNINSTGLLKISKPKRKFNNKEEERRSRLINEKGEILGYPILKDNKVIIQKHCPEEWQEDPFKTKSFTSLSKGNLLSSGKVLGEGGFGKVKVTSIEIEAVSNASPALINTCMKTQKINDNDPDQRKKTRMIREEYAQLKARGHTSGELIVRKSGNVTK